MIAVLGASDTLAILPSFALDVKKISFYDLGIFLAAMTELQYSDDVGDDEQSVLSSAVEAIDVFSSSKNAPKVLWRQLS
jgi:hypothetical protein